jgi:hypothetical protein
MLEDPGSGLGKLSYRSMLLPSDWYSTTSSGWTTVDSKSGSFTRNSSSEFASGGASTGFSLGIFSIGGSGGASKQSRHMDAATQNLRVSFEYTLVSIRRPWMMMNLLSTPGWNLQNLYPKNKVSNGTKVGQLLSVMPLIPVGFIAVRKVNISADWSQADYDFLKKTVSGGGSIGIGPFSIGGSYSHSRTNEHYQSAFAGKQIQVPGVQIIGWVSQVVPACPPA